MKIIRGLPGLRTFADPTAVTLGNFDGVHRGHQALIERTRQLAEQHRATPVVVLFEPQPLEFFRPDKAPPRLYGLRQKLQALQQSGIDTVCVLPFNRQLASFPAEAFVQLVLKDGLQARAILVGDDWRFGHERRGDYALLKRLQAEHDYQLEQAPTVTAAGERISSTRIRLLLDAGEVQQASHLLGREYGVCGRVVMGAQLGRKLQAPTANIALRRVPPLRFGVYICRLNGMPAVANFGVRPTMLDNRPSLEVHVLDRDIDLYNQHVNVQFSHWLRPEQKFDGIDDLAAQIHRDFDEARKWHSTHSAP